MEKNYLIVNESGEIVNVTKAEYEQYVKEHPEFGVQSNIPLFQTPAHKAKRSEVIDRLVEALNKEGLTSEEKVEIFAAVKTQEDIEKENRDRFDDDSKTGQTSFAQKAIYGVDNGRDAGDRKQEYIDMLNRLTLSEAEMERLEKEVESSREEPENEEEKENENGQR